MPLELIVSRVLCLVISILIRSRRPDDHPSHLAESRPYAAMSLLLQGLLLCTPAGILQWGNADVDTVLKLAEKMGSIRSLAGPRFGLRTLQPRQQICVVYIVQGYGHVSW